MTAQHDAAEAVEVDHRESVTRRISAEFVGTAALLGAIVGSGIVASSFSGDGRLFEHAVVVGAALFVLITLFGPVSGAHFNPAVTLAAAIVGDIEWKQVPGYVVAQLSGAVIGVILTHLAFDLDVVAGATTARAGTGPALSEAMATAGLILVIFGLLRAGAARLVPVTVGVFIAAAIYATSSTAFANPAVTIARMTTDTWTGIRPADGPLFLATQMAGAAVGLALAVWWYRADKPKKNS